MKNFRDINERFSVSGHFADLEQDARFLAAKNVVGVLDLAFEPDDDWLAPTRSAIAEALAAENVGYVAIPMYDGDGNGDLDRLFGRGRDVISDWEAGHPGARSLVKCWAGLSRSPSMLISYLCAAEGLRYVEAFELVSDAGELQVNWVFEDHLEARYPGLNRGRRRS